MDNKGILIVDDDDDYREYLVRELSRDYSVVAGAASGDEAIDLLNQQPTDFQFAVVHHRLKCDPDGIETTRKLVEISPQIYPVVFSNRQVVDTSPEIMEYKYKALEAGAYRYMEWKELERKRNIRDFITEIEQLTALRDWISEFFLARAAAPSLLTQLDVGIDIIDRHYKVWFMNDRMRSITGVVGPDLPKSPCAHWHGFGHYPCRGCLVSKTLEDGDPHSEFFLSPFVNRDKDRVFFLRVWTQAVTDQKGNIVRTADGKPLAVMESVQELTNSPELKAMSIQQRLQIIVDALLGIEKEPYSITRLFQYGRVYLVNRSGGREDFNLTTAAGDPNPDQLNRPIDLRTFDGDNLQIAENNVRGTGYGWGFANPEGFDPALPARPRTPYVYFPIIENNLIIALIEAGCNHIEMETAGRLRPYAREVLRAIQDDHARMAGPIADASIDVAGVELKLQTKTSPEDQLRTIVESICSLTDSHQYVVRYVVDDSARLLRLKVPELCEYEKVARPEVSLKYMQSWSSRTISARAENLIDIINNKEIILEFREYLDDRSREVLRDANGLSYEPLILEGICIGMMGFHSRNAYTYKNEKNITIVRSLARRATMALHDYMIERESREKAEADALSDTLSLVLHNIKTPLATIRVAYKRLLEKIGSVCTITPEMRECIDSIHAQLSRMTRLRDDVLRLKLPIESRVELVALEDFLHDTVQSVVIPSEGMNIQYTVTFGFREAIIDKAGMKVCLEVLLQNAVDAMKENQEGRHLRVALRAASDAENRMIESRFPGLSVDVVDNGSGISEEIARGLFRKMTSRKPKGLGMGLLHCYAFAHSAQGTVYYDDGHKNGTKFTLVFPYQRKEGGII